jgi:hypothetical protein
MNEVLAVKVALAEIGKVAINKANTRKVPWFITESP